jgi:lambda repressor-like predicted transcriptional regulator
MSQLSYEQFAEILIQRQREEGTNLAPLEDNFASVDKDSLENQLKQNTKKTSQLVAKSWLPKGKEIREILLSKDKEKILKLLEDEGITKILGEIDVEVVLNTFLGSLEDTGDPNTTFRLNLAYPPKPTDFNVSDTELEDWVDNENPQQIIPPNPYIPVTW